jgi:mono/diheme cytochrome c family protein
MRVAGIGILVVVVAVIGGAIWWLQQPPENAAASGERLQHQVDVKLPSLTPLAEAGSTVFAANCQACHGANASGGPGGPPLVHIIYEPNHHGDGSFVAAVRNGIRQHHWNFGNMAPVPGVSDQQIVEIITYVRELQRANGIN